MSYISFLQYFDFDSILTIKGPYNQHYTLKLKL